MITRIMCTGFLESRATLVARLTYVIQYSGNASANSQITLKNNFHRDQCAQINYQVTRACSTWHYRTFDWYRMLMFSPRRKESKIAYPNIGPSSGVNMFWMRDKRCNAVLFQLKKKLFTLYGAANCTAYLCDNSYCFQFNWLVDIILQHLVIH